MSQKIRLDCDFLIFDDIFPNPFSDWRYNEYVYYLKNINNTLVIANNFYDSSNYFNKQWVSDFKLAYPEHSGKLMHVGLNNIFNSKLGYCLFYNNLVKVFPVFESMHIPFVFTLYPGGGFKMFDEKVEENLARFFSSKYFRHVIVNMPHVYEYITSKFKIDKDKCTYIYGAPLNLPTVDFFPRKREVVKVVFSSHKYSSKGFDKGFDVFNKVAKHFENDNRISFAVVGGFCKDDLIVNCENIEFISELLPDKIAATFSKYDIILSPNRSHVLGCGSFDGFPTGSVLHAVNSGCMMMVTDEWDNAKTLNLIDGVDYLRISTDTYQIVKAIENILDGNVSVSHIAESGRNKLIHHIDLDNQMKKRLKIINHYL